MVWTDFLSAIALVLVIEGLMPTLNPEGWRSTMQRMGEMEAISLRKIGIVSMVAGTTLLYFIRSSS